MHRILDLGCGTGAGTFVLLERFAQAVVRAVDTGEPVLAHLAAKAAARGEADRVRTERADRGAFLRSIYRRYAGADLAARLGMERRSAEQLLEGVLARLGFRDREQIEDWLRGRQQ